MKNNITLIGMPGSGKSTVGVVLAKIRGMDFVDTDLLIQQQEGMRLQELINQRGRENFLETEADTICSVQTKNTVIAPGGSVIERTRSIAHLKTLGPIVYLQLSLEELVGRLGDISARGITLEPGQSIADLYTVRTPHYAEAADLIVDCTGMQRIEDTAIRVSRAVEEFWKMQ